MDIIYLCPKCKEENIAFVKLRTFGLKKQKIYFYCYNCKREFNLKDQSSGFIKTRVGKLRAKYPFKTNKAEI